MSQNFVVLSDDYDTEIIGDMYPQCVDFDVHRLDVYDGGNWCRIGEQLPGPIPVTFNLHPRAKFTDYVSGPGGFMGQVVGKMIVSDRLRSFLLKYSPNSRFLPCHLRQGSKMVAYWIISLKDPVDDWISYPASSFYYKSNYSAPKESIAVESTEDAIRIHSERGRKVHITTVAYRKGAHTVIGRIACPSIGSIYIYCTPDVWEAIQAAGFTGFRRVIKPSGY